jgi:hypothetical protein
MWLFVITVIGRDTAINLNKSTHIFWLLGFLEEKVYKPLPTSLAELKQRITE